MSLPLREILRAFYVGQRQQLYTYAVAITGDRGAAEDAIQAAFYRLLRRGEALPAHLRPYVFRCVRNAAMDGFRRDKTPPDPILRSGEVDRPDPAAPADDFSADIAESALRHLSPDERETIVLKIYSDLTFQDIADQRDVPLSTVTSWYRRGLEKLRALLAPELR